MVTSATSAPNLDINSIVSQLMAVERQPITKLNVKEASYQAKLTAYGSIKGAVASFQSVVQSLSSSGKFQAVKATASDSTIFSASASSSAAAGTYSLEVTSLAQAQKLVATGQASSTATIGDGTATTVTFDFGTISGGSFDTGTGKYTGASFATAAKTYAKVGVESGVTAADPHKLVSMLYQGALLAIANAKNGILRHDIPAKGKAIFKAIAIIDDGLNASLDKNVGGGLAHNLSSLYEYMCTRLITANLQNDMAALDEVARLLNDLKGAWDGIRQPAVAAAEPQPAPVAQPKTANKAQLAYASG